jgi:hypothetical protein
VQGGGHDDEGVHGVAESRACGTVQSFRYRQIPAPSA